MERQVKRHLPHGELPSKAVGQVRVAAVLPFGMAGHARWDWLVAGHCAAGLSGLVANCSPSILFPGSVLQPWPTHTALLALYCAGHTAGPGGGPGARHGHAAARSGAACMPVAPAMAFGQPAAGASLQLGEACWLGQCICGCGTTGTCQHHMCRKLLFNAPGWLLTLAYCNLLDTGHCAGPAAAES